MTEELNLTEEIVAVADLHKLAQEEETAGYEAPCTYTCSWTCWFTSFAEQ